MRWWVAAPPAALILGALSLLAVGRAQAAVITFDLSDVTFGGGAIASGTFRFDTNALSILSTTISVVGATHTEENGAYSVSGFCSGTNCLGSGVTSSIDQFIFVDGQGADLYLDASLPLSLHGATDLVSGTGILPFGTDGGAYIADFLNSQDAEIVAVPEPNSGSLLASALALLLGMLFLTGKRHRQKARQVVT